MCCGYFAVMLCCYVVVMCSVAVFQCRVGWLSTVSRAGRCYDYSQLCALVKDGRLRTATKAHDLKVFGRAARILGSRFSIGSPASPSSKITPAFVYIPCSASTRSVPGIRLDPAWPKWLVIHTISISTVRLRSAKTSPGCRSALGVGSLQGLGFRVECV